MIISITGHRPNGLPKEYGYNLNNEAWTKLKEYIEATIEECYKYATDIWLTKVTLLLQ